VHTAVAGVSVLYDAAIGVVLLNHPVVGIVGVGIVDAVAGGTASV